MKKLLALVLSLSLCLIVFETTDVDALYYSDFYIKTNSSWSGGYSSDQKETLI